MKVSTFPETWPTERTVISLTVLLVLPSFTVPLPITPPAYLDTPEEGWMELNYQFPRVGVYDFLPLIEAISQKQLRPQQI